MGARGRGALWGADVERIISVCAGRVARVGLSYGLTRDDLRQEGREAIVRALLEGRVPLEPGAHREAYIAQRARGAMVDANRRAWAQQPLFVDGIDDDEGRARDLEISRDTPDGALQRKQLQAHLVQMAPAGMVQALELLSDGLEGRQVAAVMGFDPSRISQFKKRARQLVAHLW